MSKSRTLARRLAVGTLLGTVALLAAVSLVVLVSQQAMIAGAFNMGPIANDLLDWLHSHIRWYPLGRSAMAVCAVAVAGAAVLWWKRLRRAGMNRLALVGSEVLLGVGLLGWSFRAVAVIVFVGLIGYHIVRPSVVPRRAWPAWAAVVVLSLLPFDITLQEGRGISYIVRVVDCGCGPMLPDVAAGNAVCGGLDLYNAPRWAWVW